MKVVGKEEEVVVTWRKEKEIVGQEGWEEGLGL